jgi:hypothetical protein
MMEDLIRNGLEEAIAEAVAYNEIKEIAAECGKNITEVIPPPLCEPVDINNQIIDIQSCKEEGERMYLTLNSKQKNVVDSVLKSFNSQSKCFFIDGPGGSGKIKIGKLCTEIF